jgi:two-component system LytT family response regulator
MIKAIIVDDEPYCCESLATLLQRYCPQVSVIDVCYNGATALKAINEEKPELLFLDIEMPQMNGFELLEKLKEISFQLIFTTSYDQYAIKAIRFSALDYLLKPVDREELQRAVQKAVSHISVPNRAQIEILLQKLSQPALAVSKIAIPTMEGLQMVPINSIISCGADSNYTVFNVKNRQKIIVSRTLKEIEEMLEEFPFVRVHHSFLINLNEVEKYVRGDGGYLIMSDGSSIDVSRSRKDLLMKKLQPNRS